ncbi:MAG: hypothetical protein MJZ11_07955 [Lachnospiraceae bacterium]|nr:hypothetical protein [Lachnospiraceae bacterium]
MGIFNNLIVRGVANFAHTIIGKITNAEKTDLLEWHNKPATGITGRSSWRHLVTDGEVVWGQGWSDSAMDSDSGDLSLWLRKIPGGTDSGTTTINMTLDGQIEALQGFVGTASNANALQGLVPNDGSYRNNTVPANSIIRADQHGYVNVGYINTGIGVDDSFDVASIYATLPNDSYIRKVSLNHFRDSLGWVANANTVGGLGVNNAEKNNSANALVRTDGTGYLHLENVSLNTDGLNNGEITHIIASGYNGADDNFIRRYDVNYYLQKMCGYFKFENIEAFFNWLEILRGHFNDGDSTFCGFIGNIFKRGHICGQTKNQGSFLSSVNHIISVNSIQIYSTGLEIKFLDLGETLFEIKAYNAYNFNYGPIEVVSNELKFYIRSGDLFSFNGSEPW